MLTSANITTIDVNMLMSIVNMKLRNDFSSPAALCNSLELDDHILSMRLKESGFEYISEQNQFRKIAE